MPSPPPSVYETAPTPGAEPFSGARPWGAAASTTCRQRVPAKTRAVRAAASTTTPSMRRVEISTPPSESSGSPCPVACTPTGRPATGRACDSGLDVTGGGCREDDVGPLGETGLEAGQFLVVPGVAGPQDELLCTDVVGIHAADSARIT